LYFVKCTQYRDMCQIQLVGSTDTYCMHTVNCLGVIQFWGNLMKVDLIFV